MQKCNTNIIYGSILLIGLSIYILQKSNVTLPFLVRNYANDVLIMPLMLKFIQSILKRIYGNEFRLNFIHLTVIWLYFSGLFEVIFPQLLNRYTADIFDVLAYLIGTLVFIIIERCNHDTY